MFSILWAEMHYDIAKIENWQIAVPVNVHSPALHTYAERVDGPQKVIALSRHLHLPAADVSVIK